ncbi:MAG: sterol desaturase family protein [Alphaproteobacteria bacterium]|nr:sterol desaturase family protein [Alphaproteobacteria bacterium]
MAVLLKSIIIGSWLVMMFALENITRIRLRNAPRLLNIITLKRLTRNVGLYLINAALLYPLVLFITISATQFHLLTRPDFINAPVFIIIDILLLDCMIYWWHRLNHVIPFLWRFHEVHHLDESMDASTALRFHFGEVLLSACNRAVFIALFAIPLTSVLVVETLLFCMALFHHANLRLPERLDSILSKLIVTPRIHNAHHHAKRRDTDSNYGNLFSFWDRIFGSYNARIFDADAKIGVEGRKDEGLLRLIIRPFTNRAKNG